MLDQGLLQRRHDIESADAARYQGFQARSNVRLQPLHLIGQSLHELTDLRFEARYQQDQKEQYQQDKKAEDQGDRGRAFEPPSLQSIHKRITQIGQQGRDHERRQDWRQQVQEPGADQQRTQNPKPVCISHDHARG